MENTFNSGYDSEDNNEISTAKNLKLSRCSRILDSSDEDLPKNENEKVCEEDSTVNKVMVSNKNDKSRKVKGKFTSSEDESNADSKSKTKKKIFKKPVFDDSESESDGDTKEPIIKERCPKRNSDFEMIDESNDASDYAILKATIPGHGIYDTKDSSDEDYSKLEFGTNDKVPKKKEEETNDEHKKTLMDSDIYDAEGSSDEGLIIAYEPEAENTAQKKKKDKKEKSKRNNLQRKSKQTAIEEIKSETQRLVRESRISLPYHRPKQRSLSEFLSRRKSIPVVPLKTSTDELSKVWENIEEREKIAESFYKSDSDSSGNEKEVAPTSEIFYNTNASIVENTTNNNPGSSMNFHLDYTETESQNIQEESGQAGVECLVNVNNSEANLEYIKTGDENNKSLKPCGNEAVDSDSRIQVTECMNIFNNSFDCKISIMDLDNSGATLKENKTLNAVCINDESSSEAVSKGNLSLFDEGPLCLIDDVNSTEEKTESRTIDPHKNEDRNLLNKSNLLKLNMILDDKLSKVPRLSGQPDEMIDLDKSPDKRGAVKLISRFMKHITFKQKVKVEEDVVVAISEVNEKGEVVGIKEETLTIKRNEDSLKLKVGDSFKPGETRMKLKATLQHKILQNREQQFAKRLEEFKLNEEEIFGEEKPDYEENEEELTPSESGSDDEIEDDIIMEDTIKEKNPFADEEAEESENCEEEIENDRGSESGEYSDAPSIYIGSLVDKDEGLPNLELEMGLENSQRNNELMALCSGGFTQGVVDLNELEKNDALSQFYTSEKLVPSIDSNKLKDEILDSTHEDSEEEITVKKKKKSKLTFSDDEDDIPNVPDELDDWEDEDQGSNETEIDEPVNENKDDILDEDDDEEVMEEEAVEGFEEDEENVTKKAAKRFLEAEAELSGSEWGSADEDELDLDTMEKEEGDEDIINQRKVRSELEKIHMKELLDEDKREIRVLQELFLEDGDLHSDGPKRQRQFRWYNQDGDNENSSSMWNPDSVEKGGDAEEDEEDESWRKTRLERENFLRIHKGDDLAEGNDDFKSLKVTKSIAVIKTSPMPLSFTTPDPKRQFSAKTRRGSFLSRGEKLLSKLAELSNVNTSSDNLVGNVRGTRNMVFAVVSPPKEESKEMSLKRKNADIVMNASKKLKFSAHPGKTQGRLLEKLKMID